MEGDTRNQSTRVPLLAKGYKKLLSVRPPLKSFSENSTESYPSYSNLSDIETTMVEKMNYPDMHKNDTIIIEKEAVIQVNKGKLRQVLSLKLGEKYSEDFDLFFRKVESSIRSWYHRIFEEIVHIYEYFDPGTSEDKLMESKLTSSEIDDLEIQFLSLFFYLMEKSNYKLINDMEFEVATSANYLLNLPIKVDYTKLDSDLFERFFSLNTVSPLPSFSKKHLIFRRGIGVDQTNGYFIFEKVDLVISRIWGWFMNFICCGRNSQSLNTIHDLRARYQIDDQNDDKNFLNSNSNGMEKTSLVTRDDPLLTSQNYDVDDDSLIIDRIRLENMNLNMKTLLSENVIQEPTFERMVLLYRPSSVEPKEKNSDTDQDIEANTYQDEPKIERIKAKMQREEAYKNRSIIIKQFRHIPFADMEIVWPEKVNPGLTAKDWASFMSTVVGGLIAVICSISFNLSWTVVYTIIIAVISYMIKIYFAWDQSMSNYKSLMQESMYNKQLDTGRGTLLHLCDSVWQQEVKEVAVAYFILLTRGPTTAEDLGKKCNEILANEFQENVKFDYKDAIVKLERLGIAHMGEDGRLNSKSLKAANSIIGFTTEEAYDIFPSNFKAWTQMNTSTKEDDLEEIAKKLFLQILFDAGNT